MAIPSFLSNAQKRTSDMRSFLRDSASNNGLRYSAEKGKKHKIYIPFKVMKTLDATTGQEIITKELEAIYGNVHSFDDAEGKFRTCVCMKDQVRTAEDGTVLNDGSCPLCDRVQDAWGIFRHLKERWLAENPSASADEIDKNKSSLNDLRKIKEAAPYMYLLVVKFRGGDDQGKLVLDETTGLPLYDLKVMKLSAKRVNDIQEAIENSGGEVAGSEIVISYPNIDDKRLLSGQSVLSPIFQQSMVTLKYPELLAKINDDISKFTWDGFDKAYGEWAGMTVAEGEKLMNECFAKWDEFKPILELNPNAVYLENVAGAKAQNIPMSVPQIGGQPILPVNMVQPVQQPVMAQPVMAQPVIQQMQQPVVQQMAQPVVQQPVVQQPVVQQMAQPVAQQPVVQQMAQPVAQQPVVMAELPVMQQPVMQQPVVMAELPVPPVTPTVLDPNTVFNGTAVTI